MADPSYIGADGTLTDGDAWIGIASTTLGSDAASVTFTSPNDGSSTDWSQFMDIIMVSYVRSDRTPNEHDDGYQLNINGDVTATEEQYGSHRFRAASNDNAYSVFFHVSGNGTSGWLGYIPAADATANVFASLVTTFFDINSGKWKSCLTLDASEKSTLGGSMSGTMELLATTWKKQAPITSIRVKPMYGSNLKANSRIDLFGVLPRMVQ